VRRLLTTEKNYPYWAGRVSEALRCVLNTDGDRIAVMTARECLDEFDAWYERGQR